MKLKIGKIYVNGYGHRVYIYKLTKYGYAGINFEEDECNDYYESGIDAYKHINCDSNLDLVKEFEDVCSIEEAIRTKRDVYLPKLDIIVGVINDVSDERDEPNPIVCSSSGVLVALSKDVFVGMVWSDSDTKEWVNENSN